MTGYYARIDNLDGLYNTPTVRVNMNTIPRLNVDDKPPAPVKVQSYTTHEPATSRMFPAVKTLLQLGIVVGLFGLFLISILGGN